MTAPAPNEPRAGDPGLLRMQMLGSPRRRNSLERVGRQFAPAGRNRFRKTKSRWPCREPASTARGNLQTAAAKKRNRQAKQTEAMGHFSWVIGMRIIDIKVWRRIRNLDRTRVWPRRNALLNHVRDPMADRILQPYRDGIFRCTSPDKIIFSGLQRRGDLTPHMEHSKNMTEKIELITVVSFQGKHAGFRWNHVRSDYRLHGKPRHQMAFCGLVQTRPYPLSIDFRHLKKTDLPRRDPLRAVGNFRGRRIFLR